MGWDLLWYPVEINMERIVINFQRLGMGTGKALASSGCNIRRYYKAILDFVSTVLFTLEQINVKSQISAANSLPVEPRGVSIAIINRSMFNISMSVQVLPFALICNRGAQYVFFLLFGLAGPSSVHYPDNQGMTYRYVFTTVSAY